MTFSCPLDRLSVSCTLALQAHAKRHSEGPCSDKRASIDTNPACQTPQPRPESVLPHTGTHMPSSANQPRDMIMVQPPHQTADPKSVASLATLVVPLCTSHIVGREFLNSESVYFVRPCISPCQYGPILTHMKALAQRLKGCRSRVSCQRHCSQPGEFRAGGLLTELHRYLSLQVQDSVRDPTIWPACGAIPSS